jgi:acyl carrier protein
MEVFGTNPDRADIFPLPGNRRTRRRPIALQALHLRICIMEETLRRYILTELAPGQMGRVLHPDEPLFETVLDSTSILALVTFIEEEFHIEVPDSDVVPQHFSTLARLTAYIERRSRESAASGTEVSAAGLG